MVTGKTLVAGVFVLLIVVVACIFLFESDEKKIRKQCAVLEERIAKSEGENELAIGARVMGTSKLFASPCTVNVQEYGIRGKLGPREIVQQTLALLSMVKSFTFRMHDVEITIGEKNTAELKATIEATGVAVSGERFAEPREVVCRMVKLDGEWLEGVSP